jgi:acyl-CoA reductase-like NAD-dependent aldehyde dehydrogenase
VVDIAKRRPLLGLFINNEFVPAKSGETLESTSPYDEKLIARVSAAGPEDVNAAVAAARAAFRNPEWRGLSAASRGVLLHRFAELVERDAHILATIDTWDNGKTYREIRDEHLTESVAVFKYYGGWADKIYGQTIETDENKLAYTMHEPLGQFFLFPPIPHCALSSNIHLCYPLSFFLSFVFHSSFPLFLTPPIPGLSCMESGTD